MVTKNVGASSEDSTEKNMDEGHWNTKTTFPYIRGIIIHNKNAPELSMESSMRPLVQ